MSNCKICESSTTEFEVNMVRFYECVDCGFVFKDEDFYLSQTEEKGRYDMHENDINNDGYVSMFEKFIAKAVKPFTNGGKGLDFGSGPGPVLSVLLKTLGYDMHIYDPYFSPAKVYEGEKYNLIACTETCEHFHNPMKEFRLMAQLLTEDGVISVQTEFKPTKEEFPNWYYIKDDTHVGFYDRKVFEKIAEILGLKIKYCDDKKYCVLARKH